ncbi:mitochondrial Rho GTPase 1-like protein [Tanacetum coccineum]
MGEVKEELFGDCDSRLRSIPCGISFKVLLACCLILFPPLSGCDTEGVNEYGITLVEFLSLHALMIDKELFLCFSYQIKCFTRPLQYSKIVDVKRVMWEIVLEGIKCFTRPLQYSEIVDVKRVMWERVPEGVNEYGITQVKCFTRPLQSSEMVDMKRIIWERVPQGVNEYGITLVGFLFLHALMIEKDGIPTA